VSLIALIAWIITGGFGLYLLSIWLIEYDKDFQSVAATRLPPAVLASHIMLAFGGLLVWIGYLLVDSDRLAWTAAAAIFAAATLGAVMAGRWYRVYRAEREAATARRSAAHLSLVSGEGRVAVLAPTHGLGPPERNFPLPVVIAHGAFASLTITLVVLTVLGVGGS
jgi:hypothetical protein